MHLTYAITGDLDRVRWPSPAEPARTDELWRTTCLEAFIRAGDDAGYVELNVASSGLWAAYRFEGYRMGTTDAAIVAPKMSSAGPGRFSIDADFTALPRLAQADWRVSLTAVIEDVAGGISYWALRHPPGKPDFHHPDSFVLELPAP